MATKIVNAILKFKGDNMQDFGIWIRPFEAHRDAIDVRQVKKLPTLLCCLEGNAFTKASKCLLDDNVIDYNGIIEFCGKDYRQKLQVKLQGLRFTKGKNISTFINELLVTVKDLYNLDGVVDEDTIKSIALNHITSNLDKGLRH